MTYANTDTHRRRTGRHADYVRRPNPHGNTHMDSASGNAGRDRAQGQAVGLGTIIALFALCANAALCAAFAGSPDTFLTSTGVIVAALILTVREGGTRHD